MSIISKTIISLQSVTINHRHLRGKERETPHGHTGSLSMTFKAMQGIAFYVSEQTVQELSDRIQAFLDKSPQQMLEDRLRGLHKHVNDNIFPAIKKEFGNVDSSAILVSMDFTHISPDNDMGHAEKGMTVRCGSELEPPYFPVQN